ncbi:MAG: serine/threonine-protein kinase [Thermodesulfobacteriota bacterium]
MSVGKIIGNYKISQEIGHGGMGKVYKAIHLSLERVVAIKMIHPKLISNNEMVARFYSEAKIQAKLNHPNIVTVYDFFEFQDNHYIIMEFVEGESVSKIIDHQGPFDNESGIAFFMQILDGIRYAHNKNVVHKDIKTSNFILTGTNVKVTDFGIAQIIGDPGLTSESGGIIGTPKYMAPEMILGKKIDHRADIYSLGITFYEFLTGKVPFSTTNKSDFEIRKAQVELSPPPPTEVNPKIPKKIEDIILKALSKDPDERFNDVNEFYNSINELNLFGNSNGVPNNNSTSKPVEIEFMLNNTSPDEPEAADNAYDVYGRLEKTNFAKLLSTFHHEKSYGQLNIESDFNINIFFYDGFIQFVECDDPNLRLGKLLVENKTISIKDQESAVEYTLDSGLKIGEALIKLGKITPHELSSVLELQLKLKLLNGFRCFEGFYGYKYAEHTEVETIFRIDPIQVIYDAVSQHYICDNHSASNIDIDGVIKPKDELNNKIYELNLSSIKEIKLANMINDDCSISDILDKSPVDQSETFKFLKFLDLSELISIEKSYVQTGNTTETRKLIIDPLGDKTVLLNESIIAEEMNEGLKKIQ